ncbi:unnamed protein product [Closterium sp. NIES-53]
MASLRVLAFDHEGRPVQFDTWLDDLQLYLLSDSKDSVSLFDLASGAATAPPATTDTQAMYDAVVARYSSPATAALGRLLLPYLFPELSAFATVEDLVSHLRTSDARYRATVPAEFLDRNQPPIFITLYFLVTRLPDSLCSVRDQFLSHDPTSLTIDLLEQHLLADETSAVAVGAARGTPRPPFFKGCSPSPLAPSYASAAAEDVPVAEDVGAASASAKRRSSKGKGVRGGGGGSGGGASSSRSGGGGSSGGSGGSGGGGSGGTGGGSGGSGGGGGCSGGSGGSGGGGTGGGRSGPWRGGSGGGQRHQQQRRSETQSPQLLRDRAGQTCRRSKAAIFDLDFDAILSAIYALSASAEGDCYRCKPPNPGIAAAALGASESGTLPGTAPAEALHTFTLDSGTSRCFFCDSTTLTPLPAPVPVRLADPSGGPVVARSSTVLPCPAVPSGSLSSLHLPSFSTNLVSTAALQDAMVTTTTPGGQVAASCSCRLLSHQTLLWHHRLGHPSLPHLRGMHSRLLVSSLPRSLPPLPPSPAPPSLPCVEGRQRAAPHSSSFPPTTAPLQTLHMDVKGEVVEVLIPWIHTVRLQLRERFHQDLFVLRLHSDRGGEFSSDLLRDFCSWEGILQSFTLPDSPQKNGIDERRIGLVMEVARTSMIHAAAPHFLWPFAVWNAVHQLNLSPRVSLPETSPTLRWTGEVGDASVFRVWGSRAFVRDTSVDKLSARAIPCVFLGFVPDAPSWKFSHPTSRRVFPSQDVTFNESVPFYHPLPGTAPIEVAVGSGAARGATSSGAMSGGAEPGGAESEGGGCRGAEPGGAEPAGVVPGGAEPEGSAGASPRLSLQQMREWLVQCARLRTGATGVGGAGDAGAGGVGVTTEVGGTGGTAATCPGGARTRGTGAAGTRGVGDAGAGDPTEPRAAGAGGSGGGGARAGGAGAGAGGTVRPRPYFVPLLQQVLGVPSSTSLTPPLLCPPPDQSQPSLLSSSPLPAPSPYTEQSSGLTERREPASRPVFLVRTTRRVPRSCPPPVPDTHAMALRPSSVPLRVPLPAPPESSLPEVPDLEFDRARAASPAVARLLVTDVTDPSFESTAASALVAELLDFAAAYRLDYATALVAESESASPPSVGGECALGTDVLEDRQEDFECIAAAVPCFASMLLAPEGDPDAPDIPTPLSYAEAITGPYSSQWQAAMDAEMASWKSTGTYVDEVPPPGANIFDGMWISRVKRPSGSPPAFKARYVARGFIQLSCRAACARRSGCAAHLASLAPSPADPSLFLRTDTSLPPSYVLVYVDNLIFATTDTKALTLVKSELQKRHSCTDQGELRSYLGLQITWDRARRTITLTQSHMVHQVLQRFGFQFSSPQPTPLSTSHSLSAPPLDESVEPSGPYPELVGCLMYLMTCSRPDLAYPLSLLAHYVAPGRHQKGYTFTLGSGSVSLRSTRSSSVLRSSCEAEIYAEAMAAQELRWLTYLLTDLGEQPRSPPVLYVDNKAMIALCQEHRLEHRTKHIALQYFLARELQQRGQLCLAYMATRANTADVFTKALPPGDHQRFSTVLGLSSVALRSAYSVHVPSVTATRIHSDTKRRAVTCQAVVVAAADGAPAPPAFGKGNIVRVDKEKYLSSVEFKAVDHPPFFTGLDYIYQARGEILDLKEFSGNQYALVSHLRR